ncbi:hypothetical protein HD595_007738 [Nonomuraea roseoviolacea subsp. carminata]|uniref:DUF397 domain-containing protein n=1 Tax=Nonomuraea roseoviolacea subsp. carminata TaxID=160689 RepID=A0ABT1KC74_9ACTN|nr:hypothetical protein [Nonomuraea roseoviolacea subsp. carminata]
MKCVSTPSPDGAIHSNSLGNCMTRASSLAARKFFWIGPHWWNGPRAHALPVSPAAAR